MKILELSADVRKVEGLDAQPVLLRGLHLELRELLQGIVRRCCQLLCLLQRHAPHACRRAISHILRHGDVSAHEPHSHQDSDELKHGVLL